MTDATHLPPASRTSTWTLLSSVKRFARTLPAVPPKNSRCWISPPLSSWCRFVQRTSNNDIIVGIRWELGNFFVDRSKCLRDGDGKKYQRLGGEAHGGSPKPRRRVISDQLYTREKWTRGHCWRKLSTSHGNLLVRLWRGVRSITAYIKGGTPAAGLSSNRVE